MKIIWLQRIISYQIDNSHMSSIQGLYEDVPTASAKEMGVRRMIHILSDIRGDKPKHYKDLVYIPSTGESIWKSYYYDPKTNRPKCSFSGRSLGRRTGMDKLTPKEREVVEDLARRHIWK